MVEWMASLSLYRQSAGTRAYISPIVQEIICRGGRTIAQKRGSQATCGSWPMPHGGRSAPIWVQARCRVTGSRKGGGKLGINLFAQPGCFGLCSINNNECSGCGMGRVLQ